jgi:hypothetical protein
MNHERDEELARELKEELRRLADIILDLEAKGQLLADAPRLLKLLGDARSRIFAYEVRFMRSRPESAKPVTPATESERVVDEAIQRELEAEKEWLNPWERRGDGEL